MFWILLGLTAVAAAYYFLVKPHKFWIEKNVIQTKPKFFVGDNMPTVMRQKSFAEWVSDLYNSFPGRRYGGFYQFLTPTLILRDPDLIKQITVKDFDHFVDHRSFIPEDADPLWGKNLFALTGQKWRDMRATLSPSFTSSKMRFMFTLMSEAADNFVTYFKKTDSAEIEVEMKDVFTRFTNDVIATTAFGIKVDSLNERKNQFYLMGKEATDFTGILKNLRFFAYSVIPKIMGFFKISLFSKEVGEFFRSLVKSNIKSREEQGIVRQDMIHLLMEARKGIQHKNEENVPDTGFATVEESDIGKAKGKREITDEDITAQALIFFFAGFDSVSSLMCFMTYELGVNQDIQDQLRQEIEDTWQECQGKLTYEALLKMKYMDMVMCETLRKWPNAVAVDRVCTKPYTIQPKLPGEQPVELPLNTVLWLPIFALHHDPDYYPEPEKFDPERFSDENKNKINPYMYLPFGSGPRNCIGSRFAILETKVILFHLLRNFQVIPNGKSVIPLRLNRKGFNMTAEDGFHFSLKKLTTN